MLEALFIIIPILLIISAFTMLILLFLSLWRKYCDDFDKKYEKAKMINDNNDYDDI